MLDNVPEVDNVYLTPLLRGQAPTGWYQVAVDVADKALPAQDDGVKRLLARIDRLLNGQRNLGEGFTAPTLLKAQVINVTATLFMAPDADAQQVYAQINRALAGYVAPLARAAAMGSCGRRGWMPALFSTGRQCITAGSRMALLRRKNAAVSA